MRFFFWVVSLIAALIAAAYFSELNPDPITLKFSGQSSTKISPIHLVLFCIAAGALAVGLLVGVREVRGHILNWQHSRRRKREEKVQSYYTDGVMASMSRRTAEAISLLQKVLALEPNHTRALMSLGNTLRKEKHYNEAIRLHRKARLLEEGNLEILFTLAKDLEEAKRFEEATQSLEEVLKLDASNPTALYRLRDIYIRAGKWLEAHAIQERLLKAGLPEREVRAETQIMAGLKYELGRSYLEKGEREHARRYFKEAIKLDKGYLPARIGFGESLVREGKLRQAAETWHKSYVKTGNPLFLQRLEELYLEMGEPGEMIRIYHEALARSNMDPALKLALGKLYYRLEMIDDAFDLLTTVEGIYDPTGDLQKMVASLYIRKGNSESALMAIQESLGGARSGAMIFVCSACRHETREWTGRCPQCGRWNTFDAMPAIGPAPASESGHEISESRYPGVGAPFGIV